jgi:hypothetical protein
MIRSPGSSLGLFLGGFVQSGANGVQFGLKGFDFPLQIL